LVATGRSIEQVDTFRNYFKAQGLFGMPVLGQCDYSEVIQLNLSEVQPSVPGQKRPQDRIPLPELKERFTTLFHASLQQNGYNKPAEELGRRFATELGPTVC